MRKKATNPLQGATETYTLIKGERPRPERRRSRFLSRYIVPSDTHNFVGRIFDLSIVSYQFDTYEDLARHPDCKYPYQVNEDLTALTQRVESLNLVGDLLWPKHMPSNFAEFPISRYQWLTLCADSLLMRYISVLDCALILTSSVFETGVNVRDCSIVILRKRITSPALRVLEAILDDQGSLRGERNARFHHGTERGFTQDDSTFRVASLIEHQQGGAAGEDKFGRPINVDRFFREGLVELQNEFNKVNRRLIRRLDELYEILWAEFENRLRPKIQSATNNLWVSRKL